MMPNPLARPFAVLLLVALLVPSVSLVAPQRAHAQYAVHIVSSSAPTDIKTAVETTITAIKSTLTEVNTATTAWAQQAAWWNANVLQPLAFVLSGNLMKALTAGVISFVIGKANGTGVPQFATDVLASLQTVSDSQALAYLNQFGRNSNSPFAYSISSALRINYLSKTSLAGFWSTNQCTLTQYSSNVNGFLAGNWSQGGIPAWFALTTQNQNNPYTFYQSSQSQLSTLVGPGIGGVTGTRLTQLGWGQGFMSWCGATDTTGNTGADITCPAGSYFVAVDNKCEYSDGSPATSISSASQGVNPGDPCTDSSGVPGVIKTPGTTIKATLDKVLGGQQDQITRMGNVGPQINNILGNIATVMQTVNFAAQILGGSSSGGLLGVSQSSGANAAPRLMQYQNTQGNLGVTNSAIYQNAAASSASGSSISNKITQYQSAWNTISAAANAASTSVQSLANVCTAAATTAAQAQLNANTMVDGFYYNPTPSQQNLSTVHSVFIDAARAQAASAQTTLSTVIAPVLAQAAAAAVTAATSVVRAQQIQNSMSTATDTAGSAYAADILALQALPPTMTDVVNAQQDAQAFGDAAASPAGSLNVSGGTTVDRMNLISSNAATLKTTVCNPSSSLYTVLQGG